MTASSDLPIRRLLDVGRTLVADLDEEAVLSRVLDAARELTGARYAALGVLDETRTELARFLTAGIDEESRESIGDLPKGRGVLGVLIQDPRPLRLNDVGEHPRSYGFPAAHPRMHTFLGVPILIRGQAWGNLYLTEKEEGSFTENDEQATVILAEWAAVAVENARLYEASEHRRERLERAVRGLEATRDIAVAIGGVTSLERVLELIAKRGRALVEARALLIMLRDGHELVAVTSAGYLSDPRRRRMPIAGSTSGQVLQRGRAERISDITANVQIAPAELGVEDAHAALLVPMLHRGLGTGVLAAFDRGERGGPFTETDEQLLRTFAASAANAVALAQSVESDRLRSSLAAADAERGRWARELHDETLQSLGGLRVLLSSALRRDDSAAYVAATREALKHIDQGIENLRGIIADLRPAALDELGLRPALEALFERYTRRGLEVSEEFAVPDAGGAERVLDRELETVIYRLVQESLTNVVKHAQAHSVRVSVRAAGDRVEVEVEDDGVGFDPAASTSGFGLAGMRERVYLAGGTLEVVPSDVGTTVRASLPARDGEAGRAGRAGSVTRARSEASPAG
jgi:signal transduction histidine kinase